MTYKSFIGLCNFKKKIEAREKQSSRFFEVWIIVLILKYRIFSILLYMLQWNKFIKHGEGEREREMVFAGFG